MINIERNANEHYNVVILSNEKLDATISSELKAYFITLNNEGVKNIIFDMSAVRYSDSSGLSAILVGNRLCKELNGSFVLSSLSEHVTKLIRISQLDTVLHIVPTLEEAVDLVIFNEIENQLRLGSQDN
jgi:anti-sigma B factor antagonist